MSAPYFSDIINQENASANDPMIRRVNTTIMFKRYLFQKALSVFKWTMPEHWRRPYVMYSLYGLGTVAIINTDRFGVIPQHCGLYGYDVMYCPTHAAIANPLLRGILQPRIGVECTLLHLQPDYGGIVDLVNFYGNKLLLCSEAADMNLLNSRLSYVFGAGSKKAADSFKKLYSNILNGDPATVIDNALLKPDGGRSWEPFEQNVGSNYITSDLLADMRKIENMFDTAIGIPNANTDKRERMIIDEANANNVETMSLADTWLENLKRGCEQARKMFGIELSVDWRFPPMEGGGTDAGNANNPGTV